jgi:hypothetical protein
MQVLLTLATTTTTVHYSNHGICGVGRTVAVHHLVLPMMIMTIATTTTTTTTTTMVQQLPPPVVLRIDETGDVEV